MALSDYTLGQAGTAPPRLTPLNGTQQALSSLDQVLSSGSPYLANARRRGLEQAAARGGINSSIAAGAAERSALEAAAPIVEAGLASDQAAQNVQYEEWMAQNNFNRQLQGGIFNQNLNAMNAVGEYALADPELYTPDVVSGYTNFFQQLGENTWERYFGKPKSGSAV